MIKSYVRKFIESHGDYLSFLADNALYFIPTAFFVWLGLMVLIAPNFVIAFVGSFFVFCGIVCAFLAWRFLVFKKKVEHIIREVSGRVVIQGVDLQDPFGDEEDSAEGKKIVYH